MFTHSLTASDLRTPSSLRAIRVFFAAAVPVRSVAAAWSGQGTAGPMTTVNSPRSWIPLPPGMPFSDSD